MLVVPLVSEFTLFMSTEALPEMDASPPVRASEILTDPPTLR